MSQLFIGLMSGTSMDGIDAALVDLVTERPVIVSSHCHDYPPQLRQQIEDALQLPDPHAVNLNELDQLIGEQFAAASKALLDSAGISPAQVTAIGSHGQTIRHEPNAATPYSLQLGNADVISTLTGIDTVADFRSADIDAGGQGAPLVPAFHAAVFSDTSEDRVVVNIGGIANITILPAAREEPVSGFDTGPGNTLMDGWIRRHRGLAQDEHGAWAATGRSDPRLLAAMLQDTYFHTAPPKSTGREYFNLAWVSSHLQGSDIGAVEVQATLCELTAVSIADAIELHAPATSRVLVCGGGAHNDFLMQRLAANLPEVAVESTQAVGVDPDWVEAAAFAWLAKQHLEGKPGNVPAVTGAREAVVLGSLFRHP